MNNRARWVAFSILAIGIFLAVSYNSVLSDAVSITSTTSTTTTSTTTTSTTSTTTTSTTTTSTTTTSTTTTTTTSTTTTSTTTTTTTTTIPTTTTTVEVTPEKDSVTINDDSRIDVTPYEGVFVDFDGFEGENQTLLDTLVQNLPEVYKQTMLG